MNKKERVEQKAAIPFEDTQSIIEGRQRLRRVLLEAYAKVRIPRKIKYLLESTGLTTSELFFKVWWVSPNSLFGNYSPQRMWESGGKELVVDHLFALAGDQHELIQATFKKIKSTKKE